MPDRRGLVLAAGLGSRLQPVTGYLPKPLLPLAGRTLLDRAADLLLACGCDPVVVNAHHRADRIAAHLRNRPDRARFHLSIEPSILGTAGAFHGAREVLAGADTLLACNGDVHGDVPLDEVAAAHEASGALATLVLADRPHVNTVLVDADGRVRDLADRLRPAPRPGDRRLTFTGLACYAGSFLDHVPAGPGDLVSVLCAALATTPGAVRAHVHAGSWDDLGTLPRYLDAHRRLLGPGFVSVARGAVVPGDADLHECVVLPGANLPGGVRLRRAVCGRGWAVAEHPDADPALALAAAAGLGDRPALEWITGHGSDRRFVRLRSDGRRAVVMTSPAADPDHERYLRIASFLYETGLGAPAVLAHDGRTRSVLLEDLGDDTLETLVAAQPARAADLYDRVLDRLADLQTFGVESRHRCPAAWDRAFDHAHLRWETSYFRERFLAGHLGLAAADLAPLEDEFAALAAACRRQPRTLVHRDFQAQNVLLKDGVVRLVDVQGMRWGPVAYDAVSLLWDPYVSLADDLRENLLCSFPARLAARGGTAPTTADWEAMALAAGLQRLMQALGAFAYLGHVKGRRRFLTHVPAALQRLRRLCARAADSPPSTFAPPPLPHLSGLLASGAPDDGRPPA